jgi:hypothetical protein
MRSWTCLVGFSLSALATGCLSEGGAPEIYLSPLEPTTEDNLEVNASNPEDLSIRWYQGDVYRADIEGQVASFEETRKGETWHVVVGTDSGGGWNLAEAAVTIINSPPVVTAIDLSPETPVSSDDLLATPVATDPDDADLENLSFTITWRREGSEAVIEGTMLSSEETGADQVWTVTAIPFDGESEGVPFERTFAVDNEPPVVSSVILTPDPAYEASELEAVAVASDPNGDDITLSYTWMVGGLEVPGASAATLEGDSFNKGDVVQVTVSANDGSLDGEPLSSDPLTISNSLPSIVAVVLEPDPVNTDSDLSCVPSGWVDDDSDGEDYFYSWEVDGTVAGTDATLSASTFQKHQSIQCTCTPFDGEDAGTPVASLISVVENTPPTLAGISLDPADPSVADTVSVVLGASADADGDTVSFAHAWTVNGAAAGTDATLSLAGYTRGQAVEVTVTPFDGEDAGTAVSSGTVTIVNSLPTVDSVTLYGASGSGLQTNDVLTVNAVPSDADNDSPLILQYHWYVDNVHQASVLTSSLDGATWFEKGQDVHVQVSAFDGIDYGSAYTTLPLTVVNTPPGAATISMSTATPKEGQDDIICQVDTLAADDDSADAVTYGFAWTVDGGTPTATPGQTTHADDTISNGDLVRGQVWECTVTPTDTTDAGPTSQATATVIPPFTGWPISDWHVANADVIFEAEGDYEYLEWISGAGDVDNDGLPDVLVGMVRSDYYGASKVYLIRSSSGNLAANATVLNLGDRDHDNQFDATEDKADMAFLAEVTNDSSNHYDPDLAISSMAPLGDLDGDGFDEILLGSPYADGPAGQNSGKAYLIWGSDLATGTGDFDLSNADHTYYGATAEQRVGSAVASAGDVNGDTYGDFLIGAENAHTSNSGEVYLFLGDGTQTRETTYAVGADHTFRGAPDFIANGNYYYPRNAGKEVEGVGDLDGDGLGDILIAEETSYYGLFWVFYGDTITSLGTGVHSTSDGDHLLVSEYTSSQDCSLTRVGDVDNDGADDLLIGAPGWNDGTSHDWGKTYLVLSGTLADLNSASSTDPNMEMVNADYRFEAFIRRQRAGGDVAGVGDVDADGFADFLIGAGTQGSSWVMDGAYLFLGQNLGGGGTYQISSADYKFTGEYYGSHVGRAVAGPGDINGDGLDDLLVTNSSHNQSQSRAYILLSP